MHVIVWVFGKMFPTITMTLNQQPVWCLNVIGIEYLFVQWMNVCYLCWVFLKTWSPFCGAEKALSKEP